MQRFVLGDWGTSRLRLFLFEDDKAIDACEGPGIARLADMPAAARIDILARIVERWVDDPQSIRVLLSGMAGSRNGVCEVPYASLPADCASWTRAARSFDTRNMRMTIAAGVCSNNERSRIDIMRGEETQIFGAMRLEPCLGRGAHVLLLPGTHSKWVHIEDGAIRHFRTAMTGELYALLLDHSTLFHTAAVDGDHTDNSQNEGFNAGAERSMNLQDGIVAALFEARAAQLLDNRSKSWAMGFLSGLLIGHEIASMWNSFRTAGAVRLVGNPLLVSLYKSVCTARGIRSEAMDGDECVLEGLKTLHDEPAGY
jgi:2-dehydro-3-deoxygalactonokinase